MSNTKFLLADWKPTKKQIDLVNKVVSSGRLTYGPMTRKLEKMIAKINNRKHAIFMNSGTSALHVAIQYYKDTLGWKNGDEIIIPATTFVATANTIIHNGLIPVPVDIDPDNFNIDASKIEDKLTGRTKAIIPVHLLGQVCQIDKIMRLARDFNLKVIVDSCETMGVNYKGKSVGEYGDIVCFSSYLAHIITTGVGGFVLTDNKKAADYIRSLIWHGRDNLYLSLEDNSKVPLEKLLPARYRFNLVGHSFRLTEMEAALGVDELSRLPKIVDKRRKVAMMLTRALKPFSHKKLQLPNLTSNNSWMFYPIRVKVGSRDHLAKYLESKGIQTRWIMPLVGQPVYKDLFEESNYPVAQQVNKDGFLIGCHQYVTLEQVNYLAGCISSYYK